MRWTSGACRIINIKPGRLGGFAPSLAVHDLARSRGMPLWHGGMLESGHRPRAQSASVDAAGFHAARRCRRQPPLLRARSDRSADRRRAGRHDCRSARTRHRRRCRCPIGCARRRVHADEVQRVSEHRLGAVARAGGADGDRRAGRRSRPARRSRAAAVHAGRFRSTRRRDGCCASNSSVCCASRAVEAAPRA